MSVDTNNGVEELKRLTPPECHSNVITSLCGMHDRNETKSNLFHKNSSLREPRLKEICKCPDEALESLLSLEMQSLLFICKT